MKAERPKTGAVNKMVPIPGGRGGGDDATVNNQGKEVCKALWKCTILYIN